MDNPVYIGTHADPSKKLYYLPCERLEEWPPELRLPSPHFGLFLAYDARDTNADTLASFAELTVQQGLAYLAAWGPDAERVHDIVDEVEMLGQHRARGSLDGGVADLTTWSTDEPLADALGDYPSTRPLSRKRTRTRNQCGLSQRSAHPRGACRSKLHVKTFVPNPKLGTRNQNELTRNQEQNSCSFPFPRLICWAAAVCG